MKAHPAQDDNLPTAHAVQMLRTAAAVLTEQAEVLQQTPKPKVRQAMKRALSGVLGDVETVRLAIRD